LCAHISTKEPCISAKRGLYLRQKERETGEGKAAKSAVVQQHFVRAHIYPQNIYPQKSPAPPQNEANISAKEPYISAKRDLFSAKKERDQRGGHRHERGGAAVLCFCSNVSAKEEICEQK